MRKILIVIIILFPINYTLANDYISKDPNHLSRGSFGKAYVTKLKNKNAYQIIKDPTGVSPIEKVEMFSPKKGDCSDSEHWGKKGGGVTDCNSGRQRIEVSQGTKDGVRKTSLRKNPKEYWYGYYLFVPKNFPTDDEYNAPTINQFFAFNKNTKGGFAPFLSADLLNGKFTSFGNTIIEKDELKNKWHKIEIHIRWSIKDDGFIKIYHNDKLKSETKNFITMQKDYVFTKYGIYNSRNNFIIYPSDYEFPDQTIYFAGYSISTKRENLKINRN